MERLGWWKPQRSLAGLLGSFAGLCVIVVQIGADRPLLGTLGQMGVAILAAALVGYAAGLLLKALIGDGPVPASPDLHELSGRLAVLEEREHPADVDAGAGRWGHRRGPPGGPERRRKELMAMEMGSGPDG